MKTVIITGASRGIGLSLAKHLIESGRYEVIGTSTSGHIDFTHKNFSHYKLDLSSEKSIEEFIKIISNREIYILINNAAVLLDNSGDEVVDLKLLRKTFDINVFGTISLTELVVEKFKTLEEVVNVSSEWGTFSDKDFDQFHPLYKMSKTTLNMFTKLLAERLKGSVTVSAQNPGWTKTDMGGVSAPITPAERAEEICNFLEMVKPSGKMWYKSIECEW